MAQKAKKELASRNAARLQQTRYITIAVHSFFILLRWFLSSLSPKSVLVYLLLSAPSFFIQFWFEQVGSPKYGVDGPQGGELLRSGEDLEAKGLTEFLWDILFWSWGCVSFAAAFGDRAWWLYMAIPVYGAYLAYTTFFSAKKGMAGLSGQGEEGTSSGVSKRQAKMEKRGGQRVAYR